MKIKRDITYYRDLDQSQLDHTKLLLERTVRELKIAINQRADFGKRLMTNGDRPGTGHLYSMLETLENMGTKWDEETKLYGN